MHVSRGFVWNVWSKFIYRPGPLCAIVESFGRSFRPALIFDIAVTRGLPSAARGCASSHPTDLSPEQRRQRRQRLPCCCPRSRAGRAARRAAADRILDDLRNGVAAAQVFQFLDQDYIDADEDLSMAQDDLHRMSRNLPFLREVTAVVE
ncbi:hypothetical protein [Rhizobium leguminosarum]|uniref:Uncharacterized protein n=1 Tax=Rhizobium leguminosarum TaxID=384 RepID=A0A7K3VLV0_RHILE|nr:hypothetical protein [Rhizobium leguminosarum]NEK17707.1 hypothetical protein [Rhizobium leguminosarum]